MRRCASPYETVTDVTASLSSRAAASARASSSTFLPFATDSGSTVSAGGVDTAVPSSATVRVPVSVLRVAAAAATAADRSAFGREVGGVREPGRVAAHDTDAGAALATGDELLGATLVVSCARGAAVLDEDLGEVTALAQCLVEGRSEDVGFDHRLPTVACPHRFLTGPSIGHCRRAACPQRERLPIVRACV